MNGKATVTRWGRQGGRWAPDPQSAKDAETIARWKAERDALAAATDTCDIQLDLFGEPA